MLMCIYYLYEKSPKKCVELADMDELKQCLDESDMPTREIGHCEPAVLVLLHTRLLHLDA